MLLIVDIGNTYTKFKIMETEFSFKIKTKDYTNPLTIKEVFPIPNFIVTGAIISSVSIGKEEIIKKFIIDVFCVDPLIVNHEMNTTIDYPKDNNELGSDLIAMMEGASTIINTHLTISLGTATVLNLVIDNKYIGTVIAPGILTSLNGLIDSASLISETSLSGSYHLLGTTTEECLKSGLFNGFTFLIDGFIDAIKSKYNLDDLKIFILGGFAKIIAPKIKNKNIYDDELIYKGLLSLYNRNV